MKDPLVRAGVFPRTFVGRPHMTQMRQPWNSCQNEGADVAGCISFVSFMLSRVPEGRCCKHSDDFHSGSHEASYQEVTWLTRTLAPFFELRARVSVARSPPSWRKPEAKPKGRPESWGLGCRTLAPPVLCFHPQRRPIWASVTVFQ